jgi:hypothetical protein
MAVSFENNHNFYILGAGFSVAQGYPLLADFLQQMRDAHPVLVRQNLIEEAAAIEQVLSFRRQASAASDRINIDLENIEDLFSLASSVDSGPAKDMALAIAGTLRCGRKHQQDSLGKRLIFVQRGLQGNVPESWTRSEPENETTLDGLRGWFYHAPIYEFAVATMIGWFVGHSEDRQNTFLSFNYDMVLERAFEALGIEPLYCLPVGSTLYDRWPRKYGEATLIKLHGSTNWGVSAKQTLPSVLFDYGEMRSQKLQPLIQPPTWRKEFSDVFASLWNSAVARLSTATRLIIIGYSIPETDMYFRHLLAAGLMNNVSLREVHYYSGDAELRMDRLHKVFRTHLRALNPEQGGNSFAPHSRKMPAMFYDSATCRAFGRLTQTVGDEVPVFIGPK